MPGPRKKIPAIEALEGNPTKRAITDSGIEALGEPFVAEHLMDDARGCIECIKMSMPPKIYTALDSFLLAAFATAWSIHKRATEELIKPNFQWIVVNSQGSQVQSPWLKIINQQAQLIATMGDRLGLDPKSRSALRVVGSRQTQPKSKFSGLIGHKGSSNSLSS